ncbi:hypothetical protein [Paraburkholderia fungorum]|uniref:hypothetical protein n=1 Tax=Paraburkholderia fungorum TaxID=134537 RepID=UPI00161E2381|nr:hypothetical protein [Paraburkholderia fungorum]MBB5547510.1 hypothetical protein [Paraburkholderia fungorum]
MSEVIGYTTSELIELMLSNGIHCSVDKFKAIAAEIQRKGLGATGPVIEMRVINAPDDLPADHIWDVTP